MYVAAKEPHPQCPKFGELLQKISVHLNEDYSSKTVHAKHETSISVLNRERKNFVKTRIIQNTCEEYSVGGDDSHKIVRESLAACKLDNMMSVNHCGQRLQLGNIDNADLTPYLKAEEVKKIMTPVIEQEVATFKQTIDEFCGASAHRSPSSIIQNNSYNRSRIAKLTQDIEAKQLQFVQKAGQTLRLFDKVAKQRTLPEQKDKHLERVTCLSAASTKLNLLVGNLEAHVLAETYTADNVNALKAIHAELESKQRALEKERSHSHHVLEAYLALGEEFTALVDVYNDLKNNLETYQWALNLKQS